MTARLKLAGRAGALGLLCALAAPVHAVDSVSCTFIIPQDANRNVKAAVLRASKQVRAEDIERLLAAGPNGLTAVPDKDGNCLIRHEGNALLGVRIDPQTMKLTPRGKVPSCADLQTQIRCRRGG